MARIKHRPVVVLKGVPLSPMKEKPKTSKFEVAGFLFFILFPLTLSVYWSSGHMQQWLAPALRPFLPSQLQVYLPVASGSSDTPKVEEQLSPEDLLKACEKHQYTSEIISLDPLVIYINNFTSWLEAEELINIGTSEFAESFISRSRGSNVLVNGRTSTSAPLPPSHPLVSCILSRARTFMGSMLLPHEPFSIPQLVRYTPSQKYDLHTDFWPEHQVMNDGSNRLFNRVASFFVFLRDNCTDGYTYFPLVEPSFANEYGDEERNLGELYKGKVERGMMEEEQKGVKFKPIQGNAIFWVNVDEKGNGDRRVVHAGLPVKEGEKIGLNIWPRKFFGMAAEIEPEERKERKGWSGKWKD